MNAELFALAFTAALNPKLLAVDLLLAGALCGLLGAAYLTSLHNLVTGSYSTATQAVAVVVFAVIGFLLTIISFVFLELRSDATKALLNRSQDWLRATPCSSWPASPWSWGAYLTVSGLVRLS